jgi:hypothetical protein
MYTYAATVEDSSIVEGPFSFAPCQTLMLRFATFASLYAVRPLLSPTARTWQVLRKLYTRQLALPHVTHAETKAEYDAWAAAAAAAERDVFPPAAAAEVTRAYTAAVRLFDLRAPHEHAVVPPTTGASFSPSPSPSLSLSLSPSPSPSLSLYLPLSLSLPSLSLSLSLSLSFSLSLSRVRRPVDGSGSQWRSLHWERAVHMVVAQGV